MFKIISFKELSVVAFILCILMLTGTALNLASPYVNAVSAYTVCVPIVMYHQISNNANILGDYVITPELLENDFTYLKDNGFTPVSFKQLKNFTEQGIALPQKPILITFDDGERTFLTKVVPLLEKYGFPANVNVIGSLIELYTENGETDDRYAYLNEDDIKALSENPLVELGCHTYNLHSLSNRRGMGQMQGEKDVLYQKVITEDIQLFKSYFKNITGQETNILAYPYGIKSNKLEEIVNDFGFSVTLTCRESVNELSHGSSLLNLGRFNRPYKESTENFFNRILTD